MQPGDVGVAIVSCVVACVGVGGALMGRQIHEVVRSPQSPIHDYRLWLAE